MSYDDVREYIQDGDVILFRGDPLVSRLIRLATGSKYSHVGIAFWADDHLLLLESAPSTGAIDYFTKSVRNGSQAVSLSSRIRDYRGTVFWCHVRAIRDLVHIRSVIRRVRLETSGLPYEQTLPELVGAAFWTIRNHENRVGLFCSELAAHVLWRIGFLAKKDPSNEYTPEDLSPEADRNVWAPGVSLEPAVPVRAMRAGPSQPDLYQ